MDEISGTLGVTAQSCLSRERDRVARDAAQGTSLQKILGGSQRDAILEAIFRRSCLHLRSIGRG